METFREVQSRMVVARRGSKPRRGPKTERPYLLRGRLHVRALPAQAPGQLAPRRGVLPLPVRRRVRAARRSSPTRRSSTSASVTCSPTSTTGWRSSSTRTTSTTTCEAILGAAAAEPASPAERAAADDLVRECDRKLDRYRELLEAGTDPAVVAGWIKRRPGRASGGRRRRSTRSTARSAPTINTAAEVREAVEHLGGLVGLLKVSDPKLRSRFYEEAGVLGIYLPGHHVGRASRPTHVSVRFVSEGGLEPPRPCGH